MRAVFCLCLSVAMGVFLNAEARAGDIAGNGGDPNPKLKSHASLSGRPILTVETEEHLLLESNSALKHADALEDTFVCGDDEPPLWITFEGVREFQMHLALRFDYACLQSSGIVSRESRLISLWDESDPSKMNANYTDASE